MRYCYLNGQILPEDEAKVGILDVGLLRGFGIYEAMAFHAGKIFRWEDHIARLKRSADFLHIVLPANDDGIRQIIFDLVEKNDLASKRVNVKCILTGGNAIGGIDFNPAAPTFYIFLEEWKALDPKYYADGARVIAREHLRQYPQYKTTNYITATLLQKDMREADALETLYTWERTVLECATSNFFMVRDGTLVTAKDNIFRGVTRNVVVELAQQNDLLVEERKYSLDELLSADEAFLTSSFKGVVPVVKIDAAAIGIGRPGEVTQRVSRLFEEYFAAY